MQNLLRNKRRLDKILAYDAVAEIDSLYSGARWPIAMEQSEMNTSGHIQFREFHIQIK